MLKNISSKGSPDEGEYSEHLTTNALFNQLKASGFSARVANILIHRINIRSINELRARPWLDENGKPGLRDQLLTTPGSGPKVLVEVEAFLAGADPQHAASSRTEILVSVERALLDALDAWIAAHPESVNRAEAICVILREGLGVNAPGAEADAAPSSGGEERERGPFDREAATRQAPSGGAYAPRVSSAA